MPRKSTTTPVTAVPMGDGAVLDLAEGDGGARPTFRRAAHIPLQTLDDIRVEQARVYRRMAGGRVSSQEGARMIWSLSQIAKVIEASILETRLVALEQLAARAVGHGSP